jgi:DNA-binding response OmpR family regulator
MEKTILVVDDEQDILDLVVYNLEQEGYKTISADDGEEAIQKAVAAAPDLIILDIMLPGKDGLEVLREIRKHPNAQNIPVIFLTAKDSEFDHQHAQAAGSSQECLAQIDCAAESG